MLRLSCDKTLTQSSPDCLEGHCSSLPQSQGQAGNSYVPSEVEICSLCLKQPSFYNHDELGMGCINIDVTTTVISSLYISRNINYIWKLQLIPIFLTKMRQNQTITRDLVLKIVNVVPNSPSAKSHFIPLQQGYLQWLQVQGTVLIF